MANPINNPNQDQESVEKKPLEDAFEVLREEKTIDSAPTPEKNEESVGREFQVQRQLREKIENIELADDLKQQATVQANTITSLSEEEKMKSLLKAAKEKGVVYAVALAKKMNDPYILDMLHDTLAKEGHYKDFLK